MRPKFKKSLGQSFLIDQNIQRKIIQASELKSTDLILEIGAGRGELTRLIAQKVNFVYALEIDRGLCEILQENLKDFKNSKIILQDILRFSFKKNLPKLKNRIKVIGNIPYYITSPIIARLLKYREKIETIFLTVQKEFAQRITARPGSKDYGRFSCFVQYYTQPQTLFFIKRTCFSPQPKVDSCLLRLGIRPSPLVKTRNEAFLFKIIRKAFNQRRKTLRNSLEGLVSARKLGRFFIQCRINPDIRPEDLSLQDFADLANLSV